MTVYAVPIASTASAAAIDWVEVRPAAGRTVRLVELRVSQSTEVGDAQEEMIRWFIKRGSSGITSGSGGSTPTPTPMATGYTAAFAVETVNTTQAVVGGGTLITVAMDPFNVRTGLLYVPLPEARFQVTNQEYLIAGMAAAPGDSITWEGVAFFEED